MVHGRTYVCSLVPVSPSHSQWQVRVISLVLTWLYRSSDYPFCSFVVWQGEKEMKHQQGGVLSKMPDRKGKHSPAGLTTSKGDVHL